MTRNDLERAWKEGVTRENRAAAIQALKASTGTPFPDEVSDGQLAAGLAALQKVIGATGPQVKAAAVAVAAKKKGSVQDQLNEMATAIYARR